MCVHVRYLILLCMSTLTNVVLSSESILDARNFGMYKARLVWDAYSCDSIEVYKQSIHIDIVRLCRFSHDSHQYLHNACKVGAETIIREKEQSCHITTCHHSGIIIGDVVTAIVCQYLIAPWSVHIPRSCVGSAISSCITNATSSTNGRMKKGECNCEMTKTREDLALQIEHLCGSLVKAYTS